MKFLSFFTFVAAAFADPSKTIVGNAQATPSLSTLVQVLTSPGYEAVLQALNSPGPFTVFAPSNDAFAAANVDPKNVDVVAQVLMYHVLPAVVRSTNLAALQFPQTLMTDARFVNQGGKPQVLSVTKDSTGVSINFGIPGVATLTAHVLTADVVCSNGVVHIIDRVLMFPALTSLTAQAAGLTELIAALTKANIVGAVDETASLTIFAPTNAALKAVGWEKLDIATLRAVLSYHVVNAVAFSTDLKDGQVFKTLEGKDITAHVNARGVQINDAKVVTPNVLIRNGVVHVIDKVLMPPTGSMGKGKSGKVGKGKMAKGKQGKM